MELTTVEYEKQGPIAHIRLNRPDKLNAMNDVMHAELGLVWGDLAADDDLRCAILSGNGRCFSAGADLSAGAPTETYVYTGDYPDIAHTRPLYKPIIAAMHSHVIGYGMWLAMNCDIRLATADVTFWLPEPQWGIATIPSAWFPKMMPWAIAAELLLLADRVDAERAREVGIVNRIVADDELMAEAQRTAERFCELSPMAVQGMKELMVKGATLDYGQLDALTNIVQTRVMNSEDRKEGGRAFVEKRDVTWPNR